MRLADGCQARRGLDRVLVLDATPGPAGCLCNSGRLSFGRKGVSSMKKKAWRKPEVKTLSAGSAEGQNLPGNDGVLPPPTNS